MKALEQYEALETSGKFAEEYLRIRKSAFAEGYATSLDVVDAELALSKVKTERLVALYEFDVALAELLEASGGSERFEEFRTRSDVEVQQ
jgi:outer membrane protein TolC